MPNENFTSPHRTFYDKGTKDLVFIFEYAVTFIMHRQLFIISKAIPDMH